MQSPRRPRARAFGASVELTPREVEYVKVETVDSRAGTPEKGGMKHLPYIELDDTSLETVPAQIRKALDQGLISRRMARIISTVSSKRSRLEGIWSVPTTACCAKVMQCEK